MLPAAGGVMNVQDTLLVSGCQSSRQRAGFASLVTRHLIAVGDFEAVLARPRIDGTKLLRVASIGGLNAVIC